MSRIAELTIERLSQLGEGVASFEGRTVFVRGALPGEKVAAELHEDHGVVRGRLREVVEGSAYRRAPACSYADRCGGCDWLHLGDEAQRNAKEEIVLSALEHLGGIDRASLERAPVLSAGPAMGYRRRAVLHAFGGSLGFYEQKSHDRVAIDRCPALVPALQELPASLRSALAPIIGDAEELTLLNAGKKTALAAKLKGKVRDAHKKAAEAAVRKGDLAGVVLTVEEGAPTLIGQPVLKTPAPLRPEVPLFFRPDAFTQANEEGNALLVNAAVELLRPSPQDRALELYSGNGNFTFALSARVKSVTAVESAPVSLELARRSAAEARVSNIRFVQGDSRKVAEGLAREGARFDVLLLDPPRTGAKGCEQWAQKLGVHRVVYVACDPGALARDAKALKATGFTPRSLRVVDMFPQTRHVEAVLSFERST